MGYRTPLLSEAARQVAEMADGWCGLKELDSSKGEADRLTVDAIEALHAAAAQLRRAALPRRISHVRKRRRQPFTNRGRRQGVCTHKPRRISHVHTHQ